MSFSIRKKLFVGLSTLFLPVGGIYSMLTLPVDAVPDITNNQVQVVTISPTLAQILSGRVNPSAKLPFTIEKRWADSPAAGNYDETRRDKKIYYHEGIFTGYRGYEQKGIEPLFPFGYGLCYTTFDYSDLKIEPIDKKAHRYAVSFTVTNTGSCAGTEVAQLYVGDVAASQPRPHKELKGLARQELAPKQSARVTIELDRDSFSFFNPKKGQWVVEPGAFEIAIGASSQDIRLNGKLVF